MPCHACATIHLRSTTAALESSDCMLRPLVTNILELTCTLHYKMHVTLCSVILSLETQCIHGRDSFIEMYKGRYRPHLFESNAAQWTPVCCVCPRRFHQDGQ